jgi:hypothetical protein
LHDGLALRWGSMRPVHCEGAFMKTHWSDWLMAITLLIALGAASMCEVVEWPIPVHLGT